MSRCRSKQNPESSFLRIHQVPKCTLLPSTGRREWNQTEFIAISVHHLRTTRKRNKITSSMRNLSIALSESQMTITELLVSECNKTIRWLNARELGPLSLNGNEVKHGTVINDFLKHGSNGLVQVFFQNPGICTGVLGEFYCRRQNSTPHLRKEE